jgi:hypothetical protein
MKLSKIIAWIGRVFGIAMCALLVGVIVYAVMMLKPRNESNIGFIFLIMVSALLLIFLLIFILVAWRKEITGSILYLVFTAILELLVLTMDLTTQRPLYYASLYLIGVPIFVTGLLFLISSLIQRHSQKIEEKANVRTLED